MHTLDSSNSRAKMRLGLRARLFELVARLASARAACYPPSIMPMMNGYQACVWHSRGPCEGFFDSVSPIATAAHLDADP